MLLASATAAAALRSPAVASSAAVLTSPFRRPLSSSSSLSAQPTPLPECETLPPRAQVVIAGSGLIGNSLAYHLVQHGWRDVVVIDKGPVQSDASPADATTQKYGSGLLGLFRPAAERRIVQHCLELYSSLEQQGFDVGLEQCGSLNLAQSQDRMVSLRRRASFYQPTGLKCEVLSPQDLLKLHPYLYVEDLQGGIWVPDDAIVHPRKVSEVLAHLAHQGGARYIGQCGLQRVLTDDASAFSPALGLHTAAHAANVRVAGVETEKGVIQCDYFVNCAGIWARSIGQQSHPVVKVPVWPADHFFLTFQEIPELAPVQLPSVRDYDNHIYFRKWRRSILMGSFEREARPFDVEERKRRGEDTGQIGPEHWQHMSRYIDAAKRRLPCLKEAETDFMQNTPDAFTPDGKWILGEAPEVANYYVCAGMNGNSLQGAGGVGKVLADWMVHGHPPGNMLPFEVQRFTNLHNNPWYLHKRTMEVVGRHYQLQYPLVDEFKHSRKIRTSPIFSELEAKGAVFGERMGWERPLYFSPYHTSDDPPATLPDGTFARPEFFDVIAEEYASCREGVGLIDMSSFAKFQIKGDTAESVVDYLQNLCSNNIDIPIGSIVSVGMLNEHGGYENDCMLVRKNKSDFFMVSPTQQQTRIFEWMENHLPPPTDEDFGGNGGNGGGGGVTLKDVTSMYAVLTVAGPKAKDLMAEMTNSDDLKNMHPFTFKYVNMAYASGVMVLAVTQTGEPGYSLYVPFEQALHLYERIMTVGQDYGIRDVGHVAMRYLRIEKFIPFWGEELTAETTPMEVGRTFKVNFEKKHFIGKSSLMEQKSRGVTKKLVQFQLGNSFNKDTDMWPWGGEPVYRNGEYVGTVTNSAYGFTLQKMVCLGFVQNPETLRGNPTVIEHSWLTDKTVSWDIDIGGRKVPATIHLHPPKIPAVDRLAQKDAPDSGKISLVINKTKKTAKATT